MIVVVIIFMIFNLLMVFVIIWFVSFYFNNKIWILVIDDKLLGVVSLLMLCYCDVFLLFVLCMVCVEEDLELFWSGKVVKV